MKTTDTFGHIAKLEIISDGDYSIIQTMSNGVIARKSVIKHNGGYFYCFADKYEHYRGEITER